VKRGSDTAPTDEELIKAAKKGDTRAFTALMKRYEETVFRFSFKVCRDRGQAEETLQDTFINVFRKLSMFDGKSKFSTWLYTIVINNCRMKHRKRKREEMEESLEVFDKSPKERQGAGTMEIARWEETPADIVLGKELKTILDDAIMKLPEDYRLVFVLRDMEGKSTEETASVLRISREAAKSRLRRARAFLRERLDPYMTSHRGAHS
jgi:RNA polymerase sigma-70 factor (ECF subfamily)